MAGVSVVGVFCFRTSRTDFPFCVRVSSGLCSSSLDMIPCFCVSLVRTIISKSKSVLHVPVVVVLLIYFFLLCGGWGLCGVHLCLQTSDQKSVSPVTVSYFGFSFICQTCLPSLSDGIVLAMSRHNTSDYLQSAVACQLRSLRAFSAAVVEYNSFHAGKISYFCGTTVVHVVCVS